RPRRKTPSKYVTPAARRDSVERALAERAQAQRGVAADRAAADRAAADGAAPQGGAPDGPGGAETAPSSERDDSDMTQRLFWEALDAGADPTDPDPARLEPDEPGHPGTGGPPGDG